MLVYRPQDKVKVMVLVPSVIAVLFYFIFFVLPMMAKMRQDASPAPTPIEATTAITPAASDPAAKASVATPLVASDSDSPSDTTNDPFKPPAISPDALAVAAAAGNPVKPTGASLQPALIVGPQVGPTAVKTAGGLVASPTVAPPSAPDRDLTLQGVVLAEHAVGVFRTGDQTFYKHIGDVVVDNIVLKLVSDNGVVLSKGKQLYTLEIGHSDLSPTTKLAAPEFPTMARSMAQIDKAALAYHATESPEALSTNLHTQQPTKIQIAAAAPAVKTDYHAVQPIVEPASDTHPSKVSDPAASAKIVVPTANVVTGGGQVVSVPTDGLSPEIHQVSMLVHKKKARVRHRRRPIRHGHGARRHPARGHARPRSHSKSFMSRGAE